MNISIVVAQLQAGGMERVVSICTNYWAKIHNVQLITFDSKDPFYAITKDAKQTVINCSNPSNPFSTLLSVFKTIKKLRAVVSSFDSHVTIAFGTSTNVQAILASMFSNVPVIISERSSINFNHGFIWSIGRKLTYRYADLAIYQTKRSAEQFAAKLKSPKFTVIGNPISNKYENLDVNRNRENIILHVGRQDNNKGQMYLLEALKKVDLTGWEVLLIGQGPLSKKLKEKVQEYKLSKHVRFLGLKKNVLEYYLKSKIFVLPSLVEGYPNALMEAMVSGCACISFDCENGPKELIENNINGILLPVKDVDGLSRSMQLLMQDNDHRQKLSIKSSELISNVNMRTILNQWDLALYDIAN